MQEKFKITKHFDKNGVLFLNGDDVLLKTLHGKQDFKTVTFGLDADNDYYAKDMETIGFRTKFVCCCRDGETVLTIPAPGEHSVKNALAAFAVGKYLGLDTDTIQQGLLTYRNAPMRQQIYPLNGITLIDDSYNSSPEAAKVSLDVLKSIAKGKTIAVLADMLELGEKAAGEHYGVGKHLAAIGIDTLIAVGKLSEHTAAGAKENGCRNVYCSDGNNDAYACLRTVVQPDCTILVKGSRGMHTDEIVKQILTDFEN